MASIEKLKASDGSGNANVVTIQNSRSPGASTIIGDTVLGINPDGFMATMGTPHTFIDPITSEEITVISEETAVDFSGHVDGANLEIDDIAPGYTDEGSEVGDIVIIRPTTQWSDELAEILAVAHNDDGTPNDEAIHSATPAGVVLPYAGGSAPTGYLLCNGASVLRATYPDLFTAIGTTFGAEDGSHFTLPDMRSRVPMGVGAGTFVTTFASGDVNVGTDVITVPSNSSLHTGQKLQLTTSGTLPTGLSLATDYFVIRLTATTIKLASNLINAVAGTAIDITGAGSGTNTLTVSLTNNSLGAKGGEETHANTVSEIPAHNHGILGGTIGGGSGDFVVGSTANADITAKMGNTGSSAAHNNLQPFLGLNYIIKV